MCETCPLERQAGRKHTRTTATECAGRHQGADRAIRDPGFTRLYANTHTHTRKILQNA